MVDRRRQFRAEHQDISITNKIANGIHLVDGASDSMYRVNIAKPSCTCPDWKEREFPGGCKHILKVKLAAGEIQPLPDPDTTTGTRDSTNSQYPPDWDKRRSKILKQDAFECQSCGRKQLGEGNVILDVHHIVPLAKGGSHSTNNLITVCRPCHEELHGHSIPDPGQGGTRKPGGNQNNSDNWSVDQVTNPRVESHESQDSETNAYELESRDSETRPHDLELSSVPSWVLNGGRDAYAEYIHQRKEAHGVTEDGYPQPPIEEPPVSSNTENTTDDPQTENKHSETREDTDTNSEPPNTVSTDPQSDTSKSVEQSSSNFQATLITVFIISWFLYFGTALLGDFIGWNSGQMYLLTGLVVLGLSQLSEKSALLIVGLIFSFRGLLTVF